jgi:membrane protease YdiL (CAAX protease family)
MMALLTTVKALIVYWALYYFLKRMMVLRPNTFVVMMRFVGLLCFAAIPRWVMKIGGEEASFVDVEDQDITAIVGSLMFGIPIILIVNYFNSKKESNQAVYPAIRSRVWGGGLIIVNMVSWALYLLAYEWLFRGYLLFHCVESWGLVAAIAINITIYAAAHLPKGLFETIGALPLGVVFCLIAIYTGAFWSVFILHFVMAFSNDLFSVWRNPDMRYQFDI